MSEGKKELTFDGGGYPTEQTLFEIEHWSPDDFVGLAKSIAPYFNCHGRLWVEGKILRVGTGGWSGCESIIEAMQANQILWIMRWVSSRRGGGYEFEIKPNEIFDL